MNELVFIDLNIFHIEPPSSPAPEPTTTPIPRSIILYNFSKQIAILFDQ